MERLHSYLSSVYRILIVGLIVYLYIKGMGDGLNDEHLITLAVLGVYGIGFAAIPHRKWGAYLEWLAVLGLIQYFGEITLLYFLLVVPFIHMVSLKASQLDMIVFSLLLGSLYFLKTHSVIVAVAIGAGAYITCVLFNTKFRQIGVMEKVVFSERKTNEELRIDLTQKKAQIQVVTKLFIHKKHLEEIHEVEMLVEQLMNSASDFYDSYYVKLYYYRNGVYVSMADKGENRKYQVPSELSGGEGEEVEIGEHLLRVPISYEKQPWGCIAVYGKRSRLGEDGQRVFFPFEDSDYEILSLYIDSVMTRMRELRRNEKLKKAALYDRLTNVSNRHHLEELYKELVQSAKQTRQMFSMLVLDIDHFKRFNDDFGHDIGDRVLQVVARVLQESVDEKGGDVVGRWGGEEFMVLIPGDITRGMQAAETIRSNIETYDFEYRKITVSVGGSYFGQDGIAMDELMKKADLALYRSKESGRNRVTFYEGGR